jgi:FlaA1/EpsC-like NDP-sugar epimerase
VKVTGLRPGEKLYEELLIGDNPEGTDHERIMKAHEDYVEWRVLSRKLVSLKIAAKRSDEAAIKALFFELVQGYSTSAGQS